MHMTNAVMKLFTTRFPLSMHKTFKIVIAINITARTQIRAIFFN